MEILSIRPDTHTLNAKNVAYLLKWKGSSFFNGLNVVKRNVKMQKVLHTSYVLVCSVYQPKKNNDSYNSIVLKYFLFSPFGIYHTFSVIVLLLLIALSLTINSEII